MEIKSVYETSYPGMYKLSPDSGPAFFIRPEYLPGIPFETVEEGAVFNESETDIFLDAGLACVVELKAVEYLARCEQSRFGLTQKLVQKQYDRKYIDMALTFLESKNYLSDERFCTAWLHSRSINHFEGRTKLKNELLKRGIDREVCRTAVENFFKEHSEEEICLNAYKKFVNHGKTEDKLISAMLNAGFSYNQIKIAKETFEENHET